MTATPDGEAAPRPRRRLLRGELKAKYWPTRSLEYHLLLLPEHRTVYVKNPKAACSTILLWMSRIHSGDHAYSPENIHVAHGLPPAHEVGWPRAMRLLSGRGYRFSFVREPMKRLESSYRDKIVLATEELWREPIRAVLGLAPGRTPTFEEFLTAIEQQDPVSGMDPHWRPQHVNLMHPDVSYDRIGKVESLAEDLAAVCRDTGLPEIAVTSRNVRRPSGRQPSVYDDRPDLVERARALYALDYELYGY